MYSVDKQPFSYLVRRLIAPPWTVARSALVVGELSVLQQVIPAHITASDLIVEVVTLVHKPMLSRDGEGEVGLVALVFPDHPMSNLSQLTLFPSVLINKKESRSCDIKKMLLDMVKQYVIGNDTCKLCSPLCCAFFILVSV